MGLVSKLRSSTHDLTGYFIYLLLLATQGPLLFGYHLVSSSQSSGVPIIDVAG